MSHACRPTVQEVQPAIAAQRDAHDVGFWRAVLGYVPMADDNAVDPLGHGSTVWMQELDERKAFRHAMHVDVSVAREHVATRLEAALAAGGRVVDDSHAPSHWALSDRAGNRVCICAWPDGSHVRPSRDPRARVCRRTVGCSGRPAARPAAEPNVRVLTATGPGEGRDWVDRATAAGWYAAGHTRSPKGRYRFCPDGSHMAMYDDQQTYVGRLIAFVRDVDAGRF